MSDLLSMMARHGYALTFALLFAEAIGLPFPAAIALVAAGAAVASHTLSGPGVLLAAMVALLIGDTAQFWLGRYTGWALLGFLCRLSMNPETCILRSAESFYKRGKSTLVIAKFIPGINTMAAPLAGSMKMRFGQFLRLDFAGALLYSVDLLAGGIPFARFSGRHAERFSRGRTRHGNRRDHARSPCTQSIASRNFAGTRSTASCRGYKCRNWRRVWLRTRQTACRSSTYAAMDITTSGPSVSQARSASNPTILRKRSRISRKTRTFISTVLEHAKRLAPGWRIYCRKKDSTRS